LIFQRKAVEGLRPASSAHVRWCEHGAPIWCCYNRLILGELKGLVGLQGVALRLDWGEGNSDGFYCFTYAYELRWMALLVSDETDCAGVDATEKTSVEIQRGGLSGVDYCCGAASVELQGEMRSLRRGVLGTDVPLQ
jgi:hypothetical protein